MTKGSTAGVRGETEGNRIADRSPVNHSHLAPPTHHLHPPVGGESGDESQLLESPAGRALNGEAPLGAC